MLQLSFVFDIMIHSRRVTVSESFYLSKCDITENVHNGFVK